MGNAGSCDHKITWVRDIQDEIFVDTEREVRSGGIVTVKRTTECQFATSYCQDCSERWSVIHYRNVGTNGWGSWLHFNPTMCKHHDDHLRIMTENVKHKTVNNTPISLLLAGLGRDSHNSTITTTDVECRKCGLQFPNCATMATKDDNWRSQKRITITDNYCVKIVSDSEWIINRGKIDTNE